MFRNALDKLLRKEVIVRANGTEYKGLLIEAGDQDLILKRKTGFTSIPMNRITSVRDAAEVKTLQQTSFVDPSYYTSE